MIFRRPWHYILILVVVAITALIVRDARAGEWFLTQNPRLIASIRIVPAPCNRRLLGCLSPLPGGAWEMQVKERLSPACQMQVVKHEAKHITHDHVGRNSYFMTDDGNGNLMECP